MRWGPSTFMVLRRGSPDQGCVKRTEAFKRKWSLAFTSKATHVYPAGIIEASSGSRKRLGWNWNRRKSQVGEGWEMECSPPPGCLAQRKRHQTREGGSACFRWVKVGGATVQPKKVKKDGLQAVWRHKHHPSATCSGLAAARNAKLVSSLAPAGPASAASFGALAGQPTSPLKHTAQTDSKGGKGGQAWWLQGWLAGWLPSCHRST